MTKARRDILKSAERAYGIGQAPPLRIITTVGVPFFSEREEWPAYIEANRAMLKKSQYGILVADPKCVRTPAPDERDRVEQLVMAKQKWLTTEGAEPGAEDPAVVYERLRKQLRDWQPPAVSTTSTAPHVTMGRA